jgi:hypothetical protein
MSPIASTPIDAEGNFDPRPAGSSSWTSALAAHFRKPCWLRFEDHHQRKPEVAR